jgi:hypothetical protein
LLFSIGKIGIFIEMELHIGIIFTEIVKKSLLPAHRIYLCVLYRTQKTCITIVIIIIIIIVISLLSNDWLVFITEKDSVYCAVRPETFKTQDGAEGTWHSILTKVRTYIR